MQIPWKTPGPLRKAGMNVPAPASLEIPRAIMLFPWSDLNFTIRSRKPFWAAASVCCRSILVTKKTQAYKLTPLEYEENDCSLFTLFPLRPFAVIVLRESGRWRPAAVSEHTRQALAS